MENFRVIKETEERHKASKNDLIKEEVGERKKKSDFYLRHIFRHICTVP